MKKLWILLITVAIGFPSSVGVTEVCARKFDQEWAKRVLAYKVFNKTHPEVVKRRHLDRDMSANTRRSKEWLRKQLDLNCGVKNDVTYLGDVLASPDVRTTPDFLSARGDTLGGAELAFVPQPLAMMLGGEYYPVYETHGSREGITSNGGYVGGAPWFPGGYAPVFYTPPVKLPVASTPEPSTLVMLGIGLCGLGLKFRPENGQ